MMVITDMLEKESRDGETFLQACSVIHFHPGGQSGDVQLLYGVSGSSLREGGKKSST